MNKVTHNGLKIVQTETALIVNDISYSLPKGAIGNGSNTLSVIGKKIVVNGYIFDIQTETFKKQNLWDKIKDWISF